MTSLPSQNQRSPGKNSVTSPGWRGMHAENDDPCPAPNVDRIQAVNKPPEKSPTHPSKKEARSKYKEGQVVQYTNVSSAKIVKVHFDDEMEPYYTIKLPCGKEKQTVDGRLSVVMEVSTVQQEIEKMLASYWQDQLQEICELMKKLRASPSNDPSSHVPSGSTTHLRAPTAVSAPTAPTATLELGETNQPYPLYRLFRRIVRPFRPKPMPTDFDSAVSQDLTAQASLSAPVSFGVVRKKRDRSGMYKGASTEPQLSQVPSDSSNHSSSGAIDFNEPLSKKRRTETLGRRSV